MRIVAIIGCAFVSTACLLASCSKDSGTPTGPTTTNNATMTLSSTSTDGGYTCTNVNQVVVAQSGGLPSCWGAFHNDTLAILGQLKNGSDTINLMIECAPVQNTTGTKQLYEAELSAKGPTLNCIYVGIDSTHTASPGTVTLTEVSPRYKGSFQFTIPGISYGTTGSPVMSTVTVTATFDVPSLF
jgi:hypothetical protein